MKSKQLLKGLPMNERCEVLVAELTRGYTCIFGGAKSEYAKLLSRAQRTMIEDPQAFFAGGKYTALMKAQEKARQYDRFTCLKSAKGLRYAFVVSLKELSKSLARMTKEECMGKDSERVHVALLRTQVMAELYTHISDFMENFQEFENEIGETLA